MDQVTEELQVEEPTGIVQEVPWIVPEGLRTIKGRTLTEALQLVVLAGIVYPFVQEHVG